MNSRERAQGALLDIIDAVRAEARREALEEAEHAVCHWLAEDSPMAKAGEAERAATEALIVAYLRQYPAYQNVADAIERGEYRK